VSIYPVDIRDAPYYYRSSVFTKYVTRAAGPSLSQLD